MKRQLKQRMKTTEKDNELMNNTNLIYSQLKKVEKKKLKKEHPLSASLFKPKETLDPLLLDLLQDTRL